jgi:PAS domain S-box-containing protein
MGNSEPTGSANRAPRGPAALSAELYRDVFYAFEQGFCVFEVLLDDAGRPVDYRFLEVNHAFERMTGLTSPVGKTALELVPDLEAHWIEAYGHVALTGESAHFIQGSTAMGRWFDVHASRIGRPEHRLVALLFQDITAQRIAQDERQRAEDALRASEHRFRTFADTAPAMLWVTEADGACSYLSRGWHEYTGQTEAQGLGYGWLDAVHPAERDSARRAFADANASRTPFELQHRLRRADQTYRWVIDAGRPRFGPDGSFDGYVGSVIDIHDRKLAEDRLDLAVNSGRVGLWYCDLPFDVLVWNTQVKEHFGLPPDAVVTIDTFFERIHPEDREPTRLAIETAIAEQSPYDSQYRTVGPDGRTRWIRAIGRARYDDGRPVRFDGITVDVTELVALRESAEAANRAKDEFLAMLGHELRNPLAPILTALQLLKLRGIDAAERERAIIERQVKHLVGLVDDLLDISRITRGRIELRREHVDLADVVARAVELASPLLEQQRHQLTVGVPRGLIVNGDPVRLAQVIANLLTNAAKYTEAEGTVAVEAERHADHALLRVSDTGVGIDEAMLPRVFDLFVQEPQTLARSHGGLGLGLAIVRSLVDLHGGTVSAFSRGKGAGSAFTIRLPLETPVENASIADGPAPLQVVDRSASGTRVLVVDDNVDAATLLGTLLGAFGYDIRVVHDGPSALAEARAFQPQIALIDLGLPVMDGFELAQRILQHPHPEPTRLVALTGYGQERDRQASARAGFSAHLVKPVDLEELQTVLESLASSGDSSTGAESPRPS